MCELPWRGVTILRRVLAEWREEDAVLELDSTDLQRFEESRDRLAVGLRIDSGTRRRILRWCKVGHVRSRSVDVVVVVDHGVSMEDCAEAARLCRGPLYSQQRAMFVIPWLCRTSQLRCRVRAALQLPMGLPPSEAYSVLALLKDEYAVTQRE